MSAVLPGLGTLARNLSTAANFPPLRPTASSSARSASESNTFLGMSIFSCHCTRRSKGSNEATGRTRSSPTRWVRSISTGSAPFGLSSNLADEQHEVLAERERRGCLDEFLDGRAQVVDVVGCLQDDEIAEGVDVPVWEQVSLGQGQDPDAGELDQSSLVREQLVLESREALSEVPHERLEVSLFLAAVVEQLLPVHQEERYVRAKERTKGVGTSVALPWTARIRLEPLTGVVVPGEAQDVEGPLLGRVVVAALELDREVVGRGVESGLEGGCGLVPHAEEVPVEASPLATVVGDKIPEVVREGTLLRSAEERGDQYRLTGAGLTEDRDVLLSDSGVFRHGANVSHPGRRLRGIRGLVREVGSTLGPTAEISHNPRIATKEGETDTEGQGCRRARVHSRHPPSRAL